MRQVLEACRASGRRNLEWRSVRVPLMRGVGMRGRQPGRWLVRRAVCGRWAGPVRRETTRGVRVAGRDRTCPSSWTCRVVVDAARRRRTRPPATTRARPPTHTSATSSTTLGSDNVHVTFTSATPWPCVCMSVSACACHKSVFYRNFWTNRAGFCHGGFLRPIMHCVIRKFGYLQKVLSLEYTMYFRVTINLPQRRVVVKRFWSNLVFLREYTIKEICSWLPPFRKQNLLLFIQPRWQLRRTYFLNH